MQHDQPLFIIPHREVKRRWADGALVYHIYPRSFMDSNGDGIGDLPGIVSRLDYLKGLGVTAVWLSPFYPSPMADFGYDVADYCDVDPIFGTLDDFKELMAQTGKRDMRVIIDLVPNHTSDEHKWFIESKKSKAANNPFHDWYIWRDGLTAEQARLHGHDISQETGSRPAANGLYPPNNWRDALTGGPAWEWCEGRRQFYLHSFDVRQPDLNWSNPAVREAVKAAMRFWLDMGVDGFRVDAVYWMAKEPLLSDDLPNPDYKEGVSLPYHALNHANSRGWPAVYAYLSEMADVLHEEKYADKQRFMVTEAYPEGHNPLVEYLNFYVGMDPEVAAPFNFEGLGLPWKATPWRRFLRAFHHALAQIDPHCVPSYAFGNHDQSRIVSRMGEAQARAAAVLLLTLPGMVFVYYGEEIGMQDAYIPKAYVQDPAAKGDVVAEGGHAQGRDPQRTPMQWSPDKMAGFTSGDKTWLPVHDNYQLCNVETETGDPKSFLNLYKTLGNLRAGSTTLRHGEMHVIETGEPQVLGFVRRNGRSKSADPNTAYLTLVNFSDELQKCELDLDLTRQVISSCSHTIKISGGGSELPAKLSLEPYEAVLFEVAV
jgi:alpha-glucosidase